MSGYDNWYERRAPGIRFSVIRTPLSAGASSMLLTSQDRAIFPQNLADFAQFYLKSGQIPKKTGIAFDRDFF